MRNGMSSLVWDENNDVLMQKLEMESQGSHTLDVVAAQPIALEVW